MATFYVENKLNPGYSVKFYTSVRQVHAKDVDPPEHLFEQYPRLEGDLIWVVEVGTFGKDVDGNDISPEFIYLVSLDNIDVEIQKAVEKLASKVDWGVLGEDTRAPVVYWALPPNSNMLGYTDVDVGLVPIETDVYFKLKDMESGIDLSSVKVLLTVSGTDDRTSVMTWDITNEVKFDGTIYDLQLYWEPPLRVYEEF